MQPHQLSSSPILPPKIKHLGIQDYSLTLKMMRDFTNARNENSEDEIWILEHFPVFTLGQTGNLEHILKTSSIPIVQSDRGGQITYHGPGQLIIYLLFDLKRLKLGIRNFVEMIEDSTIKTLKNYKIEASGNRCAPGVYIDSAKICSLGLRIRQGYSYHGLAFNIAMDLAPFGFINPCGFAGLKMVQLKDFISPCPSLTIIGNNLAHHLIQTIYHRT